jgi:hypothetical protein
VDDGPEGDPTLLLAAVSPPEAVLVRGRAALVAVVFAAVVIGGVLLLRACMRAVQTAVTAPEGVWTREARIEGPRRAPPGHALVLEVNGTQHPMITANDERGAHVHVRCDDRYASKTSCTLPARAESFRVWISGSCRDAPLRKSSMGQWLCDAPPDANVSVHTSIRGAWEARETSRTRLVVPEPEGGVYAEIKVLVVTPQGIEPEVLLRFTRPDGHDIIENVPWWPATCAPVAGARTIDCGVSTGELSAVTGELDVVAELDVLSLCPTETPCPRPSDAVVRIEATRSIPTPPTNDASVTSSAVGPMRTLSAADLPKDIVVAGKLSKAVAWTDKNGENIVTFAVRWVGTIEDHDPLKNAYLTAEHVVMAQPGAAKKILRTVKEQRESCDDAAMKAAFLEDTIGVTDLDGDGIGEITFAYRVTCAGHNTPFMQKLFVLENGDKYVLRASSPSTYEIDASFDGGPSVFLEHAKAHWPR